VTAPRSCAAKSLPKSNSVSNNVIDMTLQDTKMDSEQTRGSSSSSCSLPWRLMTEIASNKCAYLFMIFKQTMDKLGLKPQVLQLLLDQQKNSNKVGCCQISSLADKDCRCQIPRSLVSAVRLKFKFDETGQVIGLSGDGVVDILPEKIAYIPTHGTTKIGVSWLVCYANNILPSISGSNWIYQQCSHRCTNHACIEADHLCWESPADNQSRGNTFCQRLCNHKGCCSGQNMCYCNKLHNPPCISQHLIIKARVEPPNQGLTQSSGSIVNNIDLGGVNGSASVSSVTRHSQIQGKS
jgi:hypothetical protein